MAPLFLGAGASAPFGYPAMAGLNEQISKTLSKEDLLLLNNLQGYGGDDAEAVFQAINLATDIEQRPLSRMFKGSYVSVAEPTGKVGLSLPFGEFVRRCRSLREHMERTIFDTYQFRPDCASMFRLYSDLFSLIGRDLGKQGTAVYTTNYDRLIEEFCGQVKEYVLSDGFEIDQKTRRNIWTGSFDFPPGDAFRVRLLKLHGSLNWRLSEYGIEQVMPESRLSEPSRVYKRNLLIYPGSKEPPEVEPFKTLYDRFETEMTEGKDWAVIGFSFRDPYLNRVFRNFVRSEAGTGKLVVVGPNCERTVTDNLLGSKEELSKCIDSGRIVLLPSRFGTGDWLESLTRTLSAA